MGRGKYLAPVDYMTGAIGKGIITRMKVYHCDRQKPIEGVKEIYHRDSRDYRHTPLRPGEVVNTNIFKEASKRMKVIMADTSTEEYKQWYERFVAQREHPEENAPIDKRTGRKKCYCRLDAFIRAKLMEELRAAV